MHAQSAVGACAREADEGAEFGGRLLGKNEPVSLRVSVHVVERSMGMQSVGVVEREAGGQRTHCGAGAPQSQQRLFPGRFWISASYAMY